MDLKQQITRYAALRRQLAELDAAGEQFSGEAEAVDAELVEIERRLPANYRYGDDERLTPEK